MNFDIVDKGVLMRSEIKFGGIQQVFIRNQYVFQIIVDY